MYIIWILLVFLFLSIIRTLKGPSSWDRLLGLNLISNKIILISIFFASLNELSYLLDFAIVYALLGFVGTVFIAYYILKKKKQAGKSE